MSQDPVDDLCEQLSKPAPPSRSGNNSWQEPSQECLQIQELRQKVRAWRGLFFFLLILVLLRWTGLY